MCADSDYQIVSEESATLDGYTSQTIYGDHRTMVQFSSPSDAGFKGLTSEIADWLEKPMPNLSRPQPAWDSRTASGSGIVTTNMKGNIGTGGPPAGEYACSLSRDSTFATLVNTQGTGPPSSTL